MNDMLERYGEICEQKMAAKILNVVPRTILKQVKPTLTPHFLRHNYVTLLYEAGVDPLIALKIVGHTDYKTTANIYTHVRDEMLKKATVNMGEVFGSRAQG